MAGLIAVERYIYIVFVTLCCDPTKHSPRWQPGKRPIATDRCGSPTITCVFDLPRTQNNFSPASRFQNTFRRPCAIANPREWQAVRMPRTRCAKDTWPESENGDRMCHATVTWTGRRSQDSGRLPLCGGGVRDAEVRLCLMRRFTCR